MSAIPIESDSTKESAQQSPVIVKKYANRRLYNTESSSYITLENLAEIIRSGREFVVFDAKTGEDITRSVLTQIILEEENKGHALLPTGFLRQLISFYGENMQAMLPKFLEQALGAFVRQQEQIQRTMEQTMGNFFPFGMEQMRRQNMAMIEQAMGLFAPFYRKPQSPEGPVEEKAAPAEPSPEASAQGKLRAEIAALQAEIAELRAKLAQAEAAAKSSPASSPPAPSAISSSSASEPSSASQASSSEVGASESQPKQPQKKPAKKEES
jgi:polyhydroxyalkanoate synthesis repressor PhaR